MLPIDRIEQISKRAAYVDAGGVLNQSAGTLAAIALTDRGTVTLAGTQQWPAGATFKTWAEIEPW